MDKFFPKDKIMITGNPVRKIISHSNVTRSEGLQFFGLDENKKTVLVTGGSLGARSSNEAIAAHLPDVQTLDIQLIWQTGANDADKYISMGKVLEGKVWAGKFIQEMDKAFAAADVVVSRAGAMSIAELSVAKKPTIFVPYPFAAEDHQTVNAKRLVDKNAAAMVKDDEVQTKLFGAIADLLMDDNKRKTFSENIGKMAFSNANEIIAEEILKTIS
jgi:UDP-N-acetylglucosamine--N-acetylmuramyl-(pentapeptide) pyrophosphoryl-undecaprenol N-acetylglucosamine transferase